MIPGWGTKIPRVVLCGQKIKNAPKKKKKKKLEEKRYIIFKGAIRLIVVFLL